MKSRQDGFTLIEGLIVVAVVALLAFAGWRLYEARVSEQTDVATEEYPAVESQEDLSEVESFLMETDIDEELDTSELDQVISES